MSTKPLPPPLTLTPSLLQDKTVVIYGPSKTGKTVIIKHIMSLLRSRIDLMLVVAPSEPSNHSYDGFVDPPCIHYQLYLDAQKDIKKDDSVKGGLRFLYAIWKRQEMMASIYNRSNNIDVLSRLFDRLSPGLREDGIKAISRLNSHRKQTIETMKGQYADEPGVKDEKIKEVNTKFKRMLALIYKKYIAKERDRLMDADVSDDERHCLRFLCFNPRLLLVFDDCAAQLKPYFNKDIFRLLFYQNRHCFITVLFSCQDDTDLPTNLRKNAFISIFTEGIVCSSNFERTSNRYPKVIKEQAQKLGGVFVNHRKLAYIREDDRKQFFYTVEVPYPVPFRFGSEALHELCGKIQSRGTSMDKDNPFYQCFSEG